VKAQEDEAVWGLPDYLPEGEHIIWQGKPGWKRLAVEAFHVRKVALYFLILIGIHLAYKTAEGATLATLFKGSALLVLLGVAAIGILALLAWLYARTTIYTITNKRLVLRFGVALPLMINIPWVKVDKVDLVRRGSVSGDIFLTVNQEEKMSYWLLWPHIRPWHFSPVSPALRSVADVDAAVGALQSVVGSAGSAQRAPSKPERSQPAAAGPGRTAAYS
jgi:hypothetical protein